MVKRRRAFNKKGTLCFECENAVPCAEKGNGCEWSIAFRPVPGWKATQTGTSYRVIECPRFKKEST